MAAVLPSQSTLLDMISASLLSLGTRMLPPHISTFHACIECGGTALFLGSVAADDLVPGSSALASPFQKLTTGQHVTQIWMSLGGSADQMALSLEPRQLYEAVCFEPIPTRSSTCLTG